MEEEIKAMKQSDDIIKYEISGNGCNEIVFRSDDDRLFQMVADYIKNVVDAVNYRRILQPVKKIKEDK